MNVTVPTAPAIYTFYSPATDTVELPAVTAPQPIIVLPPATRRPRMARAFRHVRTVTLVAVVVICALLLVAYTGHAFGNELNEAATAGAVR